MADKVNLLSALWRNTDAALWELGDDAHYLTFKLSRWTAFTVRSI